MLINYMLINYNIKPIMGTKQRKVVHMEEEREGAG